VAIGARNLVNNANSSFKKQNFSKAYSLMKAGSFGFEISKTLSDF
jgi:hypothetical protein